MNTALWIAQGILIAAFLVAGSLKIFGNREMAIEKGAAYAEDFEEGHLKTIGALEVLGALALLLPAIFDTWTSIVPWAAIGLAAIMVGAFIVHLRRGNEGRMMVANVVLFSLAVFVAWGRFTDYPL